MVRKLTDAQHRALLWLSESGCDWRMDAGKITRALNSLSLIGLCEGQWGDFGPRGGRCMRWRLTSEGVTLAETILKELAAVRAKELREPR